jgi:hypothetical protein
MRSKVLQRFSDTLTKQGIEHVCNERGLPRIEFMLRGVLCRCYLDWDRMAVKAGLGSVCIGTYIGRKTRRVWRMEEDADFDWCIGDVKQRIRRIQKELQ